MKPYTCPLRALLLLIGSSALTLSTSQAQHEWDANGTGTGQTDGAGTWLGIDQWWDGAANRTWVAGSNATIGNAGAGGAITVGAVSAGTVLLDDFTGTYTLQCTGTTLIQSGGITIGAGGITKHSSGLLNARENVVLSYTGPTVIKGGTMMFYANLPTGSNFTLNNGMATDYYRQTHVNAVTNAGVTTVTATVTGTQTAKLFVDVKVTQN